MNVLKTLVLAAVILFFSACATNRPLKCNLCVIDAMSARGIRLPDANANELDSYLKKSPSWHMLPRQNNKPDHAAAYSAAEQGRTVLAAAPGRPNGHIVVVDGKRQPAWSGSWNAYLPYTYGSRRGEAPKTKLLSYQFSPGKAPYLNYFEYIKK